MADQGEIVARFGARLGNWNDRTFGGHDRAVDASRTWRVLDRIAGRLHVRGGR